MQKIRKILRISFKILGGLIAFIILGYLILNISTEPSNIRNWNDDQDTLPYAKIDGSKISIYNIRNFEYATTTVYTKRFYDAVYESDKIKKVWYIVEPFSGIPGSAHTFLSFEFEDGRFLSISVEIRKEKGESFSPIKGLFNQYEIMYVIADENDVVKLRSNYRQDLVYVYPINTTKEKAQKIFIDMITRANKLKDRPEFYNTIWNTCTTNLARHVNHVTPNRIPYFSLSVLLPASSDELAYRAGLIDTNLTFEEARTKFLINERALKAENDTNFSRRIRE